jgi:hypothetical protein
MTAARRLREQAVTRLVFDSRQRSSIPERRWQQDEQRIDP